MKTKEERCYLVTVLYTKPESGEKILAASRNVLRSSLQEAEASGKELVEVELELSSEKEFEIQSVQAKEVPNWFIRAAHHQMFGGQQQ